MPAAGRVQAARVVAWPGQPQSEHCACLPLHSALRAALPLLQNAEQQGPDHATKQAWVVRPELRQRFGLPEELPEEVQAKLAASVKAPKRKLGERAWAVLLP